MCIHAAEEWQIAASDMDKNSRGVEVRAVLW